MFKDKVYEEMDDISKLIEPYQYSVNEELSMFPDKIEIDGSYFFSSSLHVRDVLYKKCEELNLKNLKNSIFDLYQKDFFTFQMLDDDANSTDDVSFNFSTGEISGKIFLLKNKIGFEDDDVQKIAAEKITNAIQRISWRNASSSRLNEIADLFNAESVKKERSPRRKIHALSYAIKNLINSKKIDIRDVSLIEKFGKWVILYAEDGSLPSLANMAKLKIMSHQNKPIYSIQEQEV